MKVKIPVKVVIESLEARLNKNAEEQEENKRLEHAHSLALKAWVNKLTDLGLIAENASVNRWSDREVTITYKVPDGVSIPQEPKRDYATTLGGWEVQEIENAIRILNLTQDEFVSASTMKQIGRFL